MSNPSQNVVFGGRTQLGAVRRHQLRGHIRKLNRFVAVIGYHQQNRQQIVVAVIDGEDFRLRGIVVRVEPDGDVLFRVMVVRRDS